MLQFPCSSLSKDSCLDFNERVERISTLHEKDGVRIEWVYYGERILPYSTYISDRGYPSGFFHVGKGDLFVPLAVDRSHVFWFYEEQSEGGLLFCRSSFLAGNVILHKR